MERWRMEKMLPPARRTTVAFLMALVTTTVVFAAVSGGAAEAAATPHRILVDTDMDTDDLLALLYILKQNRSEFDLKLAEAPTSSSDKKFRQQVKRVLQQRIISSKHNNHQGDERKSNKMKKESCKLLHV